MALKTILKTVVANNGLGGFDSFNSTTPQQQITGVFIGFMIRNLATQNLGTETVSIRADNYHQSRNREDSLVDKPIAADEFKPVRRQCVDSAGNAIAGVYSQIPILSDGMRYIYDLGTDGDTFDLAMIFDVEPSATYTPEFATS